MVLAPESPWWLVRHERYDEARKALLSLTKAESGIPFDVDKQIAMIRATNELEKAMSEGTNYWDTFKGVDRRRTEITCMVWGNASQCYIHPILADKFLVTQAFCGAALMGFSVQFYERAGLDSENSFNFNLGMNYTPLNLTSS